MSLEQKINYQLNKVPGVKKYIKRAYQFNSSLKFEIMAKQLYVASQRVL